MVNSVGSAWGLAPAVLVVIIGVIAVLASQTLYQALVAGTGKFAQSLGYALKGLATALIVGVLGLPVYLISQMSGDQQILAGQVILGLLAAYGGLVVLGMIGERAWSIINTRHERATGETLGDRLTPEEDGESA
jgi:hypothetical protein